MILLSVPLELTAVTLLLPVVVTALVQAPILCGICLNGFHTDEAVTVDVVFDITEGELVKDLIASARATTSFDWLRAVSKLSSKTSGLPSLDPGELFLSVSFSRLFGSMDLDCEANIALLLACSMVGHSDEDDGIAAKFPRTGAGEVFASTLSEDVTAFEVVAVEVVGVVCPIVLGVFKACVTRNFALCTALLDPCIKVHSNSNNKPSANRTVKRTKSQQCQVEDSTILFLTQL